MICESDESGKGICVERFLPKRVSGVYSYPHMPVSHLSRLVCFKKNSMKKSKKRCKTFANQSRNYSSNTRTSYDSKVFGIKISRGFEAFTQAFYFTPIKNSRGFNNFQELFRQNPAQSLLWIPLQEISWLTGYG